MIPCGLLCSGWPLRRSRRRRTPAQAVLDFKISVLPGGTEMEYSGPIAFGASGALRSALNDNSSVKVLHLSAMAGSVYYARQMQYLVHDRGLTTVIDSHCLSACALVFLGGVERYMAPGAKLGFHRESAPGESPAEINMVEESDAQFMQAMGISAMPSSTKCSPRPAAISGFPAWRS